MARPHVSASLLPPSRHGRGDRIFGRRRSPVHDAVLVAVLFGPVPPIAMTDALRWFCRCAVNLTHPVTFAIPARPTLAAALNPRSVGPRNIRSGPLGLFGIAASSRNHNRGSERGLFLRRGSAARSAPAHIRHTNFDLGRQSPGLRKRCH